MSQIIYKNEKDFQGVESFKQSSQENPEGDFIANLSKSIAETALRNADCPKDMPSLLLANARDLGLMA